MTKTNDALTNLAAQLDRIDIEHTVTNGVVVLELRGTRKLKTTVALTPAPDSLRVEAFVCRKPEEKPEVVHKWLLERNRRLFGVSYALDARGDIYLVGQLPAELSDDDLDRVLGQVLQTADGDFNSILERGFMESIRREWEWRNDRGEPTRNLEAFRHLLEEPKKNSGGTNGGNAGGAARGGGAPVPK
ncbi:YbjN domain-containing protein [Corynebacterium sp. TAE3-ERU12]|uniref:YbjN domain-containing protein n=1 Tax=Corynebacterium sp. TAE3-ERU12 TaxID=2849491 RepID=UPI001C454F27|nr:YbjN domain-containing protein [Corynebacterium sp. TAE3-ERU12]MBV7294530.1 YbjN domain-containing protein [Corynebacterium sp. TAE3-ERU12]